jgi:hypothetical protein
MTSLSLSLAAAALFGAVLLVLPEAGPQDATAPFWQLHGAAPAAGDAAAAASLRNAVRPEAVETFEVAGR